MHPVIKGSLLLTAAITVVSVVLFATGFHKNFMVSPLVFVVLAIGINICAIVWTLGQTAPTSGYGKQLLHSAGVGVLAGVLIIAVSWLLAAVVFPDALTETRDAAIAYMSESGMAPEEVERQKEMFDETTPISQAIPGGMGTLLTSVVSGAICAIWKRRK